VVATRDDGLRVVVTGSPAADPAVVLAEVRLAALAEEVRLDPRSERWQRSLADQRRTVRLGRILRPVAAGTVALDNDEVQKNLHRLNWQPDEDVPGIAPGTFGVM
jgi:hypothetical protein